MRKAVVSIITTDRRISEGWLNKYIRYASIYLALLNSVRLKTPTSMSPSVQPIITQEHSSHRF